MGTDRADGASGATGYGSWIQWPVFALVKEREQRSDKGEDILAGDAANGFRARSYSGLGFCTFRSPQPTWPGNPRVGSANRFPHGLVSAYGITPRRA
jgi:hypothetical protein